MKGLSSHPRLAVIIFAQNTSSKFEICNTVAQRVERPHTLINYCTNGLRNGLLLNFSNSAWAPLLLYCII